jgi:NAD(P)H-hydrate repair Nnr-like enzyme with NAD(P)H-hydrate dehydratase domain
MSHAKGIHRRCGGQGDVLAGAVATMIAWLEKQPDLAEYYPHAALEAAKFVRYLARYTVNQHDGIESFLVTQDLIQQVGPAFYLYHRMQDL